MKNDPKALDSLRQSMDRLNHEMRTERERRHQPKHPSCIDHRRDGDMVINLAGVTNSDGSIDTRKVTSLATGLVDDLNSSERNRQFLLVTASRIIDKDKLFALYDESDDEERTIQVPLAPLYELIDMLLNGVNGY